MEITPSSISLPSEIPSSDVTVLEGHTSEVWIGYNPALYICLPFSIGRV